MDSGRGITGAEIVLPAGELETTRAFFEERLGFRLEAIGPADAPVWAVLAGHGVRLRLERGAAGAGVLRLRCRELPAQASPGELVAPNGTRIELVAADEPLPPLPRAGDVAYAVHRAAAQPWRTGRAGMRYRDLVPDRLGGALIASHIAIDADGPVPDYVHFHRVSLQLIHCVRGSARLVYEDQGPPFEFAEGDCVLQPPGIRHRVLESRGGLEVIEVTCPAAHDTGVDHELSLPTAVVRPERRFDGQRFVHSRAALASWQPRGERLLARDLGVAAATDGRADAHVVRATAVPAPLRLAARCAFALRVLLAGTASLRVRGAPATGLARGDAIVAGPDDELEFAAASPDLAWLDMAFAGS